MGGRRHAGGSRSAANSTVEWRGELMGESLGRLAILCGLPKSGKTTYAKTMRGEGWVVVCPDTVRLALHGQPFAAHAEPFVWATVELMVRALLQDEHKVLVDATNTTRKRRAQWVRMAQEFGLILDAYVMDTPVEECHYRNSFLMTHGSGSVPSEVIDRMAEQWEPVEEGGIYVVNVGALS
jgi:predicted kinase